MGTLSALVGRSATLEISDPWEFVTLHGPGPFAAEIPAFAERAILLRLRSRLRYRDVEFGHLVATARHVAQDLAAAMNGDVVPVNLVPVDTSRDLAEWERSSAAWRGWHLVGTLRLA